jgi:hypothetical protein
LQDFAVNIIKMKSQQPYSLVALTLLLQVRI